MASPEPLFVPYRTLGVVTAGVAPAVQRLGAETFAVVSVGRGWAVVECGGLTTRAVGPLLPHTIASLAARRDLTFAAAGRRVYACSRLGVVATLNVPSSAGRPSRVLLLGDRLYAIAPDRGAARAGGLLLAWDVDGLGGAPGAAPVAVDPCLTLALRRPGARPTAILHPPTYVDKLVVAFDDGGLALWNVGAGALLHTFSATADRPRGAARALAAAPALDVVAAGWDDGSVTLIDARADALLAEFTDAAGGGGPGAAAAGGPVTSLAFSTAGGGAPPLLAVGGARGSIGVWNLDARALAGALPRAHAGAPVSGLHFFAGEPRLQSAGADNALKQWLFDTGAGRGGGRLAPTAAGAPSGDAARLLRSRAGHGAPPCIVRHYGPDGTRVLTAGHDRALRLWSVVRDAASTELAQGAGLAARARKLGVPDADVKLPRVVALDAGTAREDDWANVVTAHAGDAIVRTWRVATRAAAGVALVPPGAKRRKRVGAAAALPRPPPAPATCVALSLCGNFALVGYDDGRVHRFNVQSGGWRCEYKRPGEKPADDGTTTPSLLPAHAAAVVGVASTAGNTRAVTVGADGVLRGWGFRSGKVSGELKLGAPASRLAAAPATSLVGVALAPPSRALLVVDAAKPAIVRRFGAPPDRVADLVLSRDGRWLLAASLDGSITVADVPAGVILQRLLLGAPPTSLSLSPTGDLLATAHAGARGVCLWSNQAVFGDGGALQPARVPALPPVPGQWVGGAGGEGDGSETESDEDEGGHDPAADGGDSSDDGFLPSRARRAAARAVIEAARRVAAATAEEGGEDVAPAHAARLGDGAPAPLAPGLATTSLLPRAAWAALPHAAALAARNKPQAPPTKPAAAPFFLPAVAGLAGRPVFDPSAAAADDQPTDDAPSSRVARRAAAGPGALAAALRAGAAAAAGPSKWNAAARWLRSTPPETVDAELASLTVLDPAVDADAVADIGHLLAFIGDRAASGADFELTHAFCAAVLNAHGATIAAVPALRAAAAATEAALRRGWERLDDLLASVRCAAAYASGG